MPYLLVVCSEQDKPAVVKAAKQLFGPFDHYMPTGYSRSGTLPITHYACAFDATDNQTKQIVEVAEGLVDTQVYSLGPDDRAALKLVDLQLQRVEP